MQLIVSLTELVLIVFFFFCVNVSRYLVPIYTDRSNSSEDVGCAAVFPDFDMFISLPLVASIYTAELCASFLALSRILFHDSNNFVIYLDSRNALQAL